MSTETIYQTIYDPGVPLTRPAKRRRRRRRRRVQGLERRGRLAAMTMISERPAEVEDRIQVGHWEGDCIVGAANRSAIGTLVERRTRFLILVHVPTGRPTAEVMRQGITTALNRFPAELRRTLTWDQGKELALHQKISEQTGAKVFFCDAHSPWQRGSNENMNGAAARLLPQRHRPSRHQPGGTRAGGCRDQQPAPQDPRLGTARPTARRRDAVSQRLTLQPQKIEVGSRSTSASNSSTLSVAGTRSYSWNRRLRSRQYSDHNRVAFV